MRAAARFRNIHASPIRTVLDRAATLEAEGANVVRLEIGQPDFDTPTPIKAGAIEALQAGAVGYGPTSGIARLRSALAERLAVSHGGADMWPPERVLITNGAIEAVFVALAAVVETGDEVLTIEPGWPNYAGMISVCGGVAVSVATRMDDRFQPDPDRIAASISPRTKALIVNSPNNPTGVAITPERLEAIADIAIEHDLLVISDEVYDAIRFLDRQHVSLASLPGMAERTVIVNAFSKTYAMTGWRIGYAAFPAVIAREATLAHAFINSSINTFIQYGALAALEHGQGDVERMQAAYAERRTLALRHLSAIEAVDVIPSEGTFFLFPRFGKAVDDRQLAMELLEQVHVATIPGSAFGEGGRGHVRISIATDLESLREGLERIRSHVEARS